LAQRAGIGRVWMTVQQAVRSAVRDWGPITGVHGGTGAALQFAEVVHRSTHSAAVVLM